MIKVALILVCLVLVGCEPGPTQTANLADAIGGDSSSKSEDSSSQPKQKIGNGPFGIAKGTPLRDLKVVNEEGDGGYQIQPPVTLADFDYYGVMAFPETGVCQVVATVADFQADDSGSSVRSRVDDVAKTMATKYGEGELRDFCTAGEVACMDQFWQMQLQQGNRHYAYFWQSPNDAMTNTSLAEIVVMASGEDINTSSVTVMFNFDNKKQCDDRTRSNKAEAF